MSDWTSFQSVMQDLMLAQGCAVPVSIQAFGDMEHPNFRENDESLTEYEQNNADQCLPDLKLIQEMIHKVNENGDSIETENSLNYLRPQLVEKTKKFTKNVAMTSIFENQNKTGLNTSSNEDIPPMFRRKNIHGYTKHECISIQKSTTESEPVEFSNISHEQLILSKDSKHDQHMDRKNIGNVATDSLPQAYVPSATANEYYKKYLQKSKLKEQVTESIWSKLEKELKLIDEKKKLNQCLSSSNPEQGMVAVSLLQHRHLLTGDCIVCKVAAKHGYDFHQP